MMIAVVVGLMSGSVSQAKPAGAIIINTRQEPATYQDAAAMTKTLAGYAVEIVRRL